MIRVNKSTFDFMILERKPFDPCVTENETVWPGIRFCYVINGGCEWKINGVKHSVAEGDVILFGDSQSRAISAVGEKGLKVLAIQLSRQAFENPKDYAFFCGITNQKSGVLQMPELSRIAEQIYLEAKEENEDKFDYLTAKFTEFFIKAERIFNDVKTDDFYDVKMVEMIKIIDSKVLQGISLAEISEIAKLSESTFSRRFKKCFGISFKRYVMIKRIEKATVLLKNTDKRVVDIAFECGFNSVSGFYDTFKKITGTTPENITLEI